MKVFYSEHTFLRVSHRPTMSALALQNILSSEVTKEEEEMVLLKMQESLILAIIKQ
jgi:hypothetical protein